MNDPYRDWLRQALAAELGHRRAEQLIQGAVIGRKLPAMQPFGPREVVAVLQDMYLVLQDEMGVARADRWVETATQELSVFMQSVPASSAPAAPVRPVRAPKHWGRRAHDVPVVLARVDHEAAQRSLDAIRVTPELRGLERAAAWDLQASVAELRRWEAEDRLSSLRAEHARSEMAEQVRSARAQEQLLDLTVRELEEDVKAVRAPVRDGEPLHPLRTQLSHNRLMLTQTRAFLDVFAPLTDEHAADEPPEIPAFDLTARRLDISVQLHPNVLRARHALNYAGWQAGDQVYGNPQVREAEANLTRAEAEAQQFIQATLESARDHQTQLLQLQAQAAELDRREAQLMKAAADPLSLARVQFEAQQVRGGMRRHSNRLQEAIGLLDALGSE